ncbi:hypothetical protein RRG08_014406 [Elysia crispata]|uniref:Uncharacterized protein n=1 Tax=Elysia crispata TaxID=231223 RepID=A0AAE0YVJ3_9GAST|nr:hypothetical protein RRG08_014406 [Elysia crispata]
MVSRHPPPFQTISFSGKIKLDISSGGHTMCGSFGAPTDTLYSEENLQIELVRWKLPSTILTQSVIVAAKSNVRSALTNKPENPQISLASCSWHLLKYQAREMATKSDKLTSALGGETWHKNQGRPQGHTFLACQEDGLALVFHRKSGTSLPVWLVFLFEICRNHYLRDCISTQYTYCR